MKNILSLQVKHIFVGQNVFNHRKKKKKKDLILETKFVFSEICK